MKLLLINQDWFAAEWRAAGHEVHVLGSGPQCDFRFEKPLVPWASVCKGFEPDCIVVHDNSSPIMVAGLENANIPMVFYSVDAHHHTHYHKYLAGTFDLTFVAQRDYLQEFTAQGNPAQWLPLWASRVVDASSEKKYGAVFVGTMDPKLNPDRVEFFNALKEKVPLVIERGEYWKIFPHAEIVVNQTVKGDLNFRVFEAMMCGSMLLTEASGNGLDELFTSGQHLVTYQKGNVEEAAARITEYLNDLPRCRKVAAAGRAEIIAKHQPQHRAAAMLEAIEKLEHRKSISHYFGMMVNYGALCSMVSDVDPPLMIVAALRTLRCAEQALEHNEAINHEFACYMILAATNYDLKVPGRLGAELLQKALLKYPQQLIIALSLVRDHLNNGEREAATAIAKNFQNSTVERVFELSERLISELLARNG